MFSSFQCACWNFVCGIQLVKGYSFWNHAVEKCLRGEIHLVHIEATSTGNFYTILRNYFEKKKIDTKNKKKNIEKKKELKVLKQQKQTIFKEQENW